LLKQRIPLAKQQASAMLLPWTSGGAAAPSGLALCGVLLAVPALRTLLPPGIFTLRGVLPGAIAAKTLLAFAFFTADSFLPLVFIDLHGTSAAFAGWVLTVGSLTWSTGALAQGQLADRVSAGTWIALGAAVLFVGLATCAVTLRPDASLAFAFGGWGLAGFAMGLAYNATSALAMSATRPGEEGRTSAWRMRSASAWRRASAGCGSRSENGEVSRSEARSPGCGRWRSP
jgi:MFS family permease